MPFKLVARMLNKDTDMKVLEKHFEQKVVKIGRSESNDLSLLDPRRLVSGRHAEIRQKEDRFLIVDLGSRNGTLLNKGRLVPEKEYTLSEGDQINIGAFLILFYPIDKKNQKSIVEKKRDPDTYIMEIPEKTQELIEEISRIYSDHLQKDPEARKSLIAKAICEAISKLDKETAKRTLDLVEANFLEPEYLMERIMQSTPSRSLEVSPEEYEASSRAYQGVLRIAGRYLENADPLNSPETIGLLIERIERIFSVMIGCLADAVKGRRQFEQEFDVEATRIFLWRPNPIKLAEGEKEIGRHLLDWKKEKDINRVVSDLEDVFTDLVLHQMGLIAGFKESLRGILAELDPIIFEAEGRSLSLELGPLKVPCRFWPLISWAAWTKFREKYKKLTEEEVKTFENILAPYFEKGYLSVQKKKKRT